ncbi:MAG: hypothetical protein V4568_18020 [Pseudomonadota bacterium]
MSTQYSIDDQTHGVNGWGLRFCDSSYTATIGATTDTTLAVPLNASMGTPAASVNNKFIAVITVAPSKTVYVALNATAAVPAGSTFAASTSALLPIQSARFVKAGDTLHFYSAATADISVEFYAIQNG